MTTIHTVSVTLTDDQAKAALCVLKERVARIDGCELNAGSPLKGYERTERARLAAVAEDLRFALVDGAGDGESI
jgi:hypothetical protein